MLTSMVVLPGQGEDTYPDLMALFIALLVTVIIALGVRNSVGFNNILNVVNLLVWVFIIVAGLFFLSARNWEDGSFLPYGWSGVRRQRPFFTSERVWNLTRCCPAGNARGSDLLLCFHWL